MALWILAVPSTTMKNALNFATLAVHILNAFYLAVAVKAVRSSILVALQYENLEAPVAFSIALKIIFLPARNDPH